MPLNINETPEQTALRIKHDNEVEIAKRELARRALDTIRVFNPLKHDFIFMYDRYRHKVPARSYKDMDRYLAMHFFKKICDYMIGEQMLAKAEDLKKLREQQMGHEFLDKYEENVQVWDKVPKINDPELVNEIRKVVIIGLVDEYGMEPDMQQMEQMPEAPIDFRGVHEQSFDNLEKVSKDVPAPVSTPRKETTAKVEASEVTQENE